MDNSLPFKKYGEQFTILMKIDNFVPFGRPPSGKVMKLDNFVPFGRPPSGKGIIQVMTKFVASNN